LEIIRRAVDQGVTINLLVNNRAGGNAPLIAQLVAEKFLIQKPPSSKGQLRLW
jgi:hypothetical protein